MFVQLRFLKIFRLAVLLLAGIFVSVSAFTVSAAEWPSGSVSGGDAFREEGIYEDDIMLAAVPADFTIKMMTQQLYLYQYKFTPVSNTAYFDLGETLSGTYRLSVSFSKSFVFKNPNTGLVYKDVDIDLRWFLVIDGQKIYPVRDSDGNSTFVTTFEYTYGKVIGIGYEGHMSRVYVGSTGTSPSELLNFDCTVTTTNFSLVKYRESEIDYLYSIDNNLNTLNNTSRNILTVLNNVNSSLTTIYNQLVNDHQSIYSLIASFASLVYPRLDTLHTDLTTIHTDIATTLTNNLKSWFATNHTDLVNLLNQTTQGYDSSAGEETNDKLSGSLGGMTEAEDAISSGASGNLEGYNPSASLNFAQGLLSGLSLVTNFANSFFLASGDFKLSVSVLYTLAFLSIVVGLWRFVRK